MRIYFEIPQPTDDNYKNFDWIKEDGNIFDASGIEPNTEDNYLWYEFNNVWYPDLTTFAD